MDLSGRNRADEFSSYVAVMTVPILSLQADSTKRQRATHTALGISGLTRHGRRVRFYSTVDLVNALEQ